CVLAAPWRRALPGAAAPRRYAPAVPPLWVADHAARAGSVPDLLPVLAHARLRPPAAAASAALPRAAPLPDLRPARPLAALRSLQCLLHVLVSPRSRAPCAPVAALMEPPEGYALVTCPRCGRGYQMLEAAPAAFCSVACADAAHRPATRPPD